MIIGQIHRAHLGKPGRPPNAAPAPFHCRRSGEEADGHAPASVPDTGTVTHRTAPQDRPRAGAGPRTPAHPSGRRK
ncbi:hypothetical protein SSCG_05129 [Streptomyces clavuligerus]|nr:hypothetical protein SSCG_05129 [Streptomyces clavuligerus]